MWRLRHWLTSWPTRQQKRQLRNGDKLSDVHNEALIARRLKNFQTLRPTNLITYWAIYGQRQ